MWCQNVENGRMRIMRLDGSLWAEGAIDDKGMQGEVTFYAPDGKVAVVRRYVDNNTDGDDDIRIDGVELPPTVAPVRRPGR